MIVRRPRCKPPVFCLIHFKARRPEIPIIAGRTYRFPYHTLLSPICQQRAACRRGHADAAVHLASSSNSRATGCTATIEAARKPRTAYPPTQPSFGSSLFPKGWQGGGAAPLLAFRRKRNPPMIPKRSGRAAQTSRWDVWAKGKPIKGFPAGRSPAPPTHQTKPAPARRNVQTLQPAIAINASDWSGVRHAAISSKLRPREPRAACGPPFLLFGLRPRRNE